MTNVPTDFAPADLRKLLNSHGHSFHYAVLRRAEELAAARKSNWIFEAAEFPVTIGGEVIHIDFILRLPQTTTYLVAECKRADPALARWCFLHSRYRRRDASDNEVVFQQVDYHPAHITVPKARIRHASIPSTHLAVELRTGKKGDGVSGGAAINNATSQVLRATNGLIDQLFAGPDTRFKLDGTAIFIPAIFTTAEVRVAEGDVSEADVATGNLPDGWGKTESKPWIWYTYNQSPALRHQLEPADRPDTFDLSGVLPAEFSRTIAVISPSGLDQFLGSDVGAWL